MLAPVFPAATVAGNVETSQAVTGALYAALGVQAEGSGTMNNVTFGNDRVQYYETVASGSGAGDGFDGADAVQTHMTNSRLTDPEVLEWRYPVRVDSFAIRSGSGGTGRWHGGCGVERRLRFLEPMTVALLTNHRRVAAVRHGGRRPRCAGRATPSNGPTVRARNWRAATRRTSAWTMCWCCAHRAAEVTGRRRAADGRPASQRGAGNCATGHDAAAAAAARRHLAALPGSPADRSPHAEKADRRPRYRLGRGGQVALGDDADDWIAGRSSGWSWRKRTGSPSGGTWRAPSGMPSLGSSPVRARSRGGPSVRRPMRLLAGETRKRPVVRVCRPASVNQASRGPGRNGRRSSVAGPVCGTASAAAGGPCGSPRGRTAPSVSGSGPRPDSRSAARLPRTGSVSMPPAKARWERDRGWRYRVQDGAAGPRTGAPRGGAALDGHRAGGARDGDGGGCMDPQGAARERGLQRGGGLGVADQAVGEAVPRLLEGAGCGDTEGGRGWVCRVPGRRA